MDASKDIEITLQGIERTLQEISHAVRETPTSFNCCGPNPDRDPLTLVPVLKYPGEYGVRCARFVNPEYTGEEKGCYVKNDSGEAVDFKGLCPFDI